MSVTKRLMAQGGFTLKLKPETPRSVRAAIAVYDHVVVTGVALDTTTGFSDTAILNASIFTGVVERWQSSGLELGGFDLGYWLGTDDGRGDLLDTAVAQSSATLSSWISALLPSSIVAGTITNTGLSTVTANYFGMTRREAIDAVCMAANRAEWRVNPNGTLDAAAPATLFTNTPTTVVTRKKDGQDSGYYGVEATEALANVSAEGYVSKGIAVTAGMRVGSASITPSYKDLFNNTVVMERFVNAPDANPASAINIAGSVVDQGGIRTELKLRSDTYAVTRFVQPGDWVYVYDLDAGLVDTSNKIDFRGELISPKKLRVYSLTFPIESGMGVYARRSGSTPTYTDLTPYVEFEDGATTSWDVGASWLPATSAAASGATARFGDNPEVTTRNYLPGGTVGYAEITAAQTGITTAVDITNLAVTWTAAAGRRYRVAAECFALSSVANDWAAMRITNASNTQLQADQKLLPSTTLGLKYHCEVVLAPSAGSQTVKVRMDRITGTGSITCDAGATYPAFLLVEDIGPA